MQRLVRSVKCFRVAGVKFCPSPLTVIVVLTTLSHSVQVCDEWWQFPRRLQVLHVCKQKHSNRIGMQRPKDEMKKTMTWLYTSKYRLMAVGVKHREYIAWRRRPSEPLATCIEVSPISGNNDANRSPTNVHITHTYKYITHKCNCIGLSTVS